MLSADSVLTISGIGAMPNYTSDAYGNSNTPWYSHRLAITRAVISTGVTNIGGSAFAYCTGLTNITISSSVTSIGNGAFWSCTNLTSIIIPNSVTNIEGWAFAYCSGLTSITIPSSITSIGNEAFFLCSVLTSIDVDAANQNYSSESGVLFNKAKTTLIQYPTGKQGNYTIPSGVTSIEFCAFHTCIGLTSITISSGLTNIGGSAFAYCTGLAEIKVEATVPPIFSGGALFLNVNRSIPVYVPAASVQAYKNAAVWGIFTNIIGF